MCFLWSPVQFVCYKGSHTLQFRQARRDSNPHHPDLESGALPFELLAYSFERLTSFPYEADADDKNDSIF